MECMPATGFFSTMVIAGLVCVIAILVAYHVGKEEAKKEYEAKS